MDTITHSLLGAVVVRSLFPAQRSKHPLTNRQRIVVGATAGAFPDIDYIASWIDPMIYLTLWHRSITHSFVLLPLWAVLVGITLSLAFKQRGEWRFVSLLAAVSVLSHVLSDLITVYGTQVFAPLSQWRASIGTTFIIDPWFSLIVLFGFIAGLRNKSVRLPQVSLAVLVSYIGFQAVLKQQALAIAQQHPHRNDLTDTRIAALPQPFSPFNWKLIIGSDNHYDVAYVNLAGAYSRSRETGFWAKVYNTYRPPGALSWQRHRRYGDEESNVGWVRSLWENRQLDYFRRFAEFPALYRIDRNALNTCVWFTDLRYVLPFLTPPFRYGLCRETMEAGWQLNRLRQVQ